MDLHHIKVIEKYFPGFTSLYVAPLGILPQCAKGSRGSRWAQGMFSAQGCSWGPESREAERAVDEEQEHWVGLPELDTHRLLQRP